MKGQAVTSREDGVKALRGKIQSLCIACPGWTSHLVWSSPTDAVALHSPCNPFVCLSCLNTILLNPVWSLGPAPQEGSHQRILCSSDLTLIFGNAVVGKEINFCSHCQGVVEFTSSTNWSKASTRWQGYPQRDDSKLLPWVEAVHGRPKTQRSARTSTPSTKLGTRWT